jgi:hypothetical protein
MSLLERTDCALTVAGEMLYYSSGLLPLVGCCVELLSVLIIVTKFKRINSTDNYFNYTDLHCTMDIEGFVCELLATPVFITHEKHAYMPIF